jgi:four helix bundle protein
LQKLQPAGRTWCAGTATRRLIIPETRVIGRGITAADPGRMAPRDLIERTRQFALAVRSFCARLPVTDEAQEAGRQLRRAGNSVRNNYRAARKGRTRPRFEDKLGIAREEADECVDWLEYLRDARIQDDPALLDEANQIAAILTAAVKTAKANTQRLKRFPRT